MMHGQKNIKSVGLCMIILDYPSFVNKPYNLLNKERRETN